MKLEYIVKNIIQNNKIKTQSELTKILCRKGIDTTQSNISRILKKINTVKIVDENKNVYYAIHERPLDTNSKIKSLVSSISHNDSNIIIKTYNNAAPIINQILSERNMDGIASTICNSNTVLIMLNNQENIEKIIGRIKLLFLSEK